MYVLSTYQRIQVMACDQKSILVIQSGQLKHGELLKHVQMVVSSLIKMEVNLIVLCTNHKLPFPPHVPIVQLTTKLVMASGNHKRGNAQGIQPVLMGNRLQSIKKTLHHCILGHVRISYINMNVSYQISWQKCSNIIHPFITQSPIFYSLYLTNSLLINC